MSSVSPTNQDLSNDTTFSQIKSRVPVPLSHVEKTGFCKMAPFAYNFVLNQMGFVMINPLPRRTVNFRQSIFESQITQQHILF